MRVVRKAIRIIVAIALIGAVSLGIGLWIITTPSIDFSFFEKYDNSYLKDIMSDIEVYDNHGNMHCIASKKGDKLCRLSELNRHTINSFLAIEDARFYNHGAIDVYRIGGAALKNLVSRTAKEGGSTITQQLIKNVYLSSEKTFDRKIKEIRLSRAAENEFTKDEILEMYLNNLYFGHGIYGIENASEQYFGIKASALSIEQSALLAAIINSPNKYDPYNNNANAESRKNLVLKRMVELGYINKTDFTLAPTPVTKNYFNDSLFLQLVLKNNKDKKIIISGFDASIQNRIESIANYLVGNSDYLCGIVVVDAASRKIAAACNNATYDISSLRRSPGSTIKPILCYAPALEKNTIHPLTHILDEKTNFDGYSPNNYNNEYYGWVSAEDALSLSLNVPAVKLLNICGMDYCKMTAEKMGLKLSRFDTGLATALGGMKYGFTLAELATAYTYIVNPNQSIKAETAYFLYTMLQKTVKCGTAKLMSDIPNVCAKTGTVGTAQGNTDAYCIAANKKYVTAVWIGSSDSYLPGGLTGGGLPTEICREIYKSPAMQSEALSAPSTIVSIDIDTRELEKKHRLVKADAFTLPKDRKSVEFSIYNLPKSRFKEDLFCGDYDNFKIVDGFGD